MKPRIFAGLPEEERERIKAEKAKAEQRISEAEKKERFFDKVVEAVTHVFCAYPITSHKKGDSVNARASAYILLRGSGWGWVEIGKRFNRTLGSVINAVNKANDWIRYDPKFRQLHEKVLTLVNKKP